MTFRSSRPRFYECSCFEHPLEELVSEEVLRIELLLELSELGRRVSVHGSQIGSLGDDTFDEVHAAAEAPAIARQGAERVVYLGRTAVWSAVVKETVTTNPGSPRLADIKKVSAGT